MTRKRGLILGGAVLLVGLGALGLWLLRVQTKRAKMERYQAEIKRQELAMYGEPPPAPPARVRELGPNSTQPRAAREAAVLDLLAGRKPALELPVIATDLGTSWDANLRERLAPTRSVRVLGPGRPGDCDCPPGDPLCSCL